MTETLASSNTQRPYGFYGRLHAEFPSQIIVDVTEQCNLACTHCPHPEFKQSEHYAGRHLTVELNQKLVDEVREHGAGHTQYIRYTSNGEPLLHAKIFEMLAYAKAHSGTTVTLTTNGTALTATNVERLLETGVDLVDISIDALTPEVYAKIRVKGNLEITRRNVLRLLERRTALGHHVKVVTSFVEQPGNTHEMQAFHDFWTAQGVDYVVLRRLHSAAGAVSAVAEAMWADVQPEARTPCVYPWERVVLGPSGQLAFCPADWTHGAVFTDFREVTIRETWQGEFYRKLREAHLSNNFSCHSFCGNCPDWKATRWPHEGRAYADMVEDFRREGADVSALDR
jgi:pyruvate-formate lyase-activating enzyme